MATSQFRRISGALLLLALLVLAVITIAALRDRTPVAFRNRYLIAGLLACALAGVGFRFKAPRIWLALGLAVNLLLSAATYVKYKLPSPRTLAAGNLPQNDFLANRGGHFRFPASQQGRSLVLVWFRGTWCPYCRKQLRELSEALPPYRDGVTLVAVSSDTVQEHRTMEEELRIQVTMLSDPGGPLVTMCPVSHCVALVGPDGSIRWSSTSGNWDKLNAEALIQNAYELR